MSNCFLTQKTEKKNALTPVASGKLSHRLIASLPRNAIRMCCGADCAFEIMEPKSYTVLKELMHTTKAETIGIPTMDKQTQA